MKPRRFAQTSLLAFLASLAAVAPLSAQASDWRRVQALAPGAPIVVSRDDAAGARDRTVVHADADVLVVLNLTGTNLNKRDLASLVDAADRFTRPGPGRTLDAVTVDAVRIAADGVWVNGQRFGDVDQRIERIPRAVVVEIRERGHRVGSKVGAVIGAAGGAVLGVGTAIAIATENQCGGSCADEKLLVGVSLVGIPVGTGLLGYHAFSTRKSDLIYRR